MIEAFILPFLLQLETVPQAPYTPQFTTETIAVMEQMDSMELDALIASLDRLADTGDDSALEVLGEIFSFGLFGFDRDPVRACDYFERVGPRRADSLHNQATCYFAGEGREADHAKARLLYVAAAEAGWIMAYCAYGNMLVRGEGGPVDAARGVRLCQMTAAAGDADAQTDYGGYLLMGQGVARDPVAARFMLEQAAEQEQRNAAFLLGQIHAKGDGVPVDDAAAGDWFAKAYEWGRRGGAYQAGLAYARRGFRTEDESYAISPDLLTQAIEWFELAARHDPEAEVRAQAAQMIVNTQKLLDTARRARAE